MAAGTGQLWGLETSTLEGGFLITRSLQISFQVNTSVWKQATLSSAKHKSLRKSDAIKMDMWLGLGTTLWFQSILTRLFLRSDIFLLWYYLKKKKNWANHPVFRAFCSHYTQKITSKILWEVHPGAADPAVKFRQRNAKSGSDLTPRSQPATPCSHNCLPGGWLGTDCPSDTQEVIWSLSCYKQTYDFHLHTFSLCTKCADLYFENWVRTSQPFQCKQLSVEFPNSFIPLQLLVSSHS